jgi:hypothetical protein
MSMRVIKITVLVLLMMSILSGCEKKATQPQTSVTIPLTFHLDMETNSILSTGNRSTDISWFGWDRDRDGGTLDGHYRHWLVEGFEVKRLVFNHEGTKAAVCNDEVSFEEIDEAFVRRQVLKEKFFLDLSDESKEIWPGMIIIFKKADGTSGKLRVEGFRTLHDLDFPEARECLPDRGREIILEHDDEVDCHIQLIYQLLN